MINLIFGFFLGLAVATVGFSGIARYLDGFVSDAKVVIKENVK